MKELYAHSANSQGKRHRLDDHLKEVATLSKKFADKFSASDRAYWTGNGMIWRSIQDDKILCA